MSTQKCVHECFLTTQFKETTQHKQIRYPYNEMLLHSAVKNNMVNLKMLG